MAGPEIIAAIAAAAGTGVQAIGAIQQGRTASAAAAHNAQVAELEAARAKEAAEFEEDRFRANIRRLRSAQFAAAGASGVQLEGSALLGITESTAEAEEEVILIRRAGTIAEARSRSEAAFQRLAGRSGRTASLLTGGATLLTGASRTAQLLDDS